MPATVLKMLQFSKAGIFHIKISLTITVDFEIILQSRLRLVKICFLFILKTIVLKTSVI